MIYYILSLSSFNINETCLFHYMYIIDVFYLTSSNGVVKGGGGGGSRSRFTENKTVLSQFTKTTKTIKHLFPRFTENNYAKSRFTANMEFTRKKLAI